jgi:hypothetical protein
MPTVRFFEKWYMLLVFVINILLLLSGCLPLLIQLLHGSDKDSGLLGNTRGSKAARARAAAALHNIVHSHPDDKRGRREARVLRLLEQIRAHCDQLRDSSDEEDEGDRKSTTGSTGESNKVCHSGGVALHGVYSRTSVYSEKTAPSSERLHNPHSRLFRLHISGVE